MQKTMMSTNPKDRDIATPQSVRQQSDRHIVADETTMPNSETPSEAAIAHTDRTAIEAEKRRKNTIPAAGSEKRHQN